MAVHRKAVPAAPTPADRRTAGPRAPCFDVSKSQVTRPGPPSRMRVMSSCLSWSSTGAKNTTRGAMPTQPANNP